MPSLRLEILVFSYFFLRSLYRLPLCTTDASDLIQAFIAFAEGIDSFRVRPQKTERVNGSADTSICNLSIFCLQDTRHKPTSWARSPFPGKESWKSRAKTGSWGVSTAGSRERRLTCVPAGQFNPSTRFFQMSLTIVTGNNYVHVTIVPTSRVAARGISGLHPAVFPPIIRGLLPSSEQSPGPMYCLDELPLR